MSAKNKQVMIPVIRITNPFNPRDFVREEFVWKSSKALIDYFPTPSVDLVVSINGKIIPRDEFPVTYLSQTDNLVICPVPTGGGDGKSVLRMVAMIAITYFSAGMASGIYGAMGGTFVSAGAATSIGLIQAGVVMAGSMLVNSVLAPPQATKASDAKSSSYGIDGAKNTSLEGIPVPVCYGEFRMAGNILGLHVDNDVDDNQTLYMLISAGEGPVASLSDVMINDNPAADYKDVEVQTRLGLANQLAIPWFNDTITAVNKSQKMTTDWFYSTTSTSVDKVRLDFTAPQGLYEIDTKKGDTVAVTVNLEIQYRAAHSSAAWLAIPTNSEVDAWQEVTQSVAVTYDSYGTAVLGNITWFIGSTQVTDPAALLYLSTAPVTDAIVNDRGGESENFYSAKVSRYPIYTQVTRMSASKKSAVRKSFGTPKLTPQKYELRFRRTTVDSKLENVVDSVYLSDINEIVLETLSYPNTALVALKVRMTDQLSGLPKVSYINGGRVIKTHGRQNAAVADDWYDSASKNPAWVVWDILTNRRFGGQMSESRLDFVAFKEWAEHCAVKNLAWNGVIDTEMNVWDAMQLVLRVGHAQLINVGTRWTVVVEKLATPTMMFSVANMVEGSYKETWLGTADRANEIDVTFFDKTDDYKQRVLKLYDPVSLSAGAKQRTSSITLFGVTDYETAYKEAQLQLNMNRFILKTVSFSAPMEAVACSVGDVIYVQHDMTEWAVAGRFAAGSTPSVIKLDRDVTMVAGKQYKALLSHDAVLRGTGSVSSVMGTSVLLTGYSGVKVDRININGRDLRVAGSFVQGAGYGAILDDSTGIMPGATYSVWETDVIEEYGVVNQAGSSSSLTLMGPASFAPEQYANWMFGEADKVKSAFRIKSITGSHDYTRDITAIEYKPEVYDFSRYGSNTPVIPIAEGVISPARHLSAYEETYVSGLSILSRVTAAWQSPMVGIYAGADVYVKKNGGELVKVGEVKNRNSITIDAAKADVIVVKVVAFDIFNKRSAFDLAPSVTYTVIGEVRNIDVGEVTGADYIWSGRDCKLQWRYNSVTHSYEFGSEPTGADAGALDPHFKDYEIRVYDKTHKILRRTDYVVDKSYTYTYDKNFSDGVTRHVVFEIRMRDTFNNLGKPTTLDAYNPPPTILTTSQTVTYDSATIAYTHSTDADFAGASIWLSRNANDLTDLSASNIGTFLVYKGPDSSILLPNLMFNANFYYRIAAYDAFGMDELVPSAVINFKTSFFNVDTIKEEAVNVGKFAKGIDPVGIVDALPNPLTHVRPVVVFLTTDGKMYRLVNKVWTSAIPAVDINGQLIANQIADAAINTAKFAQGIDPIGIVDVLPNPLTHVRPQIVFLTTDGKMYRLVSKAWTSAIPAVDINGQLIAAQIADAAISTAKFAQGIDPIGIVEVLPNPLTHVRPQIVFLTTDGKMYRLVNKAWTSAIPAIDINGQLIASQIADAAINTAKFAQGIQPVGIVSTLPGVAGYTGPLVVFLMTDGKMYRLVSGEWTSTIPAVDITGQLTAAQVAQVQAASIAGTLTSAQIASIDSTKITGTLTSAQIASVDATKVSGLLTAAQIASIDSTKITGTLTSAQIASVDATKMTGQITATQIGDGAISTAKLAVGAITAGKIAAGAITAGSLAANSITAAEISAGAITAGKIAAGAITANEIAAGAITAGKISAGAVTATSIAAGAITANEIAASAITTAKISAGAVTTAALAAGAVTADEIAANAITTAKISAGAVTAATIAAGAITAGKIAAGAITATEIATGAITATKIAAGAITATELAANSITSGKIAAGAITATEIAAGAISAGKIAAGVITATELAANSITAGKIAAGAITAGSLAANSITATELAANSITAGKIAAGAITSTEIAAGAITAGKIAAGAITANELAANSITAGKIAAGAITAGSLAANSITSNELAANSITAGKVSAGAISSTEIAAGAINADKLATTKLLTVSAQIGNALIVNAHIGDLEVNTVKIAGNAITVPASGSTSCSIYMPFGGTVYVTANVWMYENSASDGGSVTAAYSLQINCSTGAQGGYCINHQARARHATSTTACKFAVDAGWTHFSIQMTTTGYGGTFDIYGASMMAIGTMK